MSIRGELALRAGLLCACVLLSSCGGRLQGAPTREADDPESMAGGDLHGTEIAGDSKRERIAQEVARADRPALPRELAVLEGLKREAERVRGLRFVRDFELRVQPEEAIAEFVRHEIDARRLRRARAAAVALGLLDPKVTGDDIMDEMSKIELQGYYDPTHQRLVLRDDVAMGLGAAVGRADTVIWRSVIVHELVHALQDQHFGLEEQLFSRRSTDAHHAYMALMEGDATLAMMRYIVARVGFDFDALLGDQALFDRTFSGLPAIHGVGALDTPAEQRPEVFRYQSGAMLAAGVVREGGLTRLDRAHAQPPSSTRQVIEYDLYIHGHGRPKVNRIPTELLRQSGHELLHEDVMGRLELSSYLSAGGAGGDMLASGWKADRLLVFRRGEQLGSIWVVLMDKPDEARVVIARALDAVGRKTRAAGGTFETIQAVDTAVLIRNADPKVMPRLTQALQRWAMSEQSVRYPRLP